MTLINCVFILPMIVRYHVWSITLYLLWEQKMRINEFGNQLKNCLNVTKFIMIGKTIHHPHNIPEECGTGFIEKCSYGNWFNIVAGLRYMGLWINLPTTFHGLLGPQKNVTVNFTETVCKQTAILLVSSWYQWSKTASWVPKSPRHKMCYFFTKVVGSLRGYLGVRDVLFQYLWKHSIFDVMCLESPWT